jgi:hypothetical protein
VSMYHLQRNSHGREFVGSFEEFFNYFLSDLSKSNTVRLPFLDFDFQYFLPRTGLT